MFALEPEIFDHAVAGFGIFSSNNRQLDPKFRELGLTRSGFNRGSQSVFSQHSKASRRAGLSDAQARGSPELADRRGLLAGGTRGARYADELMLADGRVVRIPSTQPNSSPKIMPVLLRQVRQLDPTPVARPRAHAHSASRTLSDGPRDPFSQRAGEHLDSHGRSEVNRN